MSLHTFFRYFGSKWRIAPRYPRPRHDVIIEPFAGSAGYSVRHHRHRVILVERDPIVAGIWRYLLRASAREILALPDLPEGGASELTGICEEARQLIRYNINRASGNRDTYTRWSVDSPDLVWGRTMRARLAMQVDKIRHWELVEGSYETAPDVEATWFVDPPYERLGSLYPHGASEIDFEHLAAWCRSRRGQVMVCEAHGAAWLPFRLLAEVRTVKRGGPDDGVSREAIWTNDAEAQAQATA